MDRAELEMLLQVALTHDTSTHRKSFIDGDAVVIPFDCFDENQMPAICYERVRTRTELLDALGYG